MLPEGKIQINNELFRKELDSTLIRLIKAFRSEQNCYKVDTLNFSRDRAKI